ncbi:hypothetical protein [Paludibaculum fermentans]|uniref:Zinc-finger domain-containing protein n=1 Tax=Paludibaculum fermentans TaxID=1473598 RepID=A0A7S7NWD4_PALFE|nr:hypothetical protein [Paludibaculum fermentans]QOY91002.1 hypothetical protein IRI77_13975 [Paludibaculum fermentans]
MKSHPGPEQLALFAGNDLNFWPALQVRIHLYGCAQCASEVAVLRSARQELHDRADELPEDLDWSLLEAEMSANIRLGLSAGAIVGRPVVLEPAPVPEAAGWRLAVVLASLSFVAAAGWWLRNPANLRPIADPAAAVLSEARPDGLALQNHGAALTLLNHSKQPAVTTVSWDGGARASFVDSETGQVTIHHVSAQ